MIGVCDEILFHDLVSVRAGEESEMEEADFP